MSLLGNGANIVNMKTTKSFSLDLEILQKLEKLAEWTAGGNLSKAVELVVAKQYFVLKAQKDNAAKSLVEVE